MKKTFYFGLLATFIIGGLTACNTATNTNSNSNRMNASSANNSSSTAGNMVNSVSNTISNSSAALTTFSPDDFMKAAAEGGLAEVEMGRLAVTKAQNAEVKKFGQWMVDDHSKIDAEIKALAEKKNMTQPAGVGSNKSTVDELKGLSGAEFDKEYVEAMVDDHEEDVTAFQRQADNGTDPEVKAFAAKTLPVLKKHLEAIKAIQAKMP